MATKFLVVLDTMWGPGRVAPRWYCINPRNHSGKRLYWLTNTSFGEIRVTNACKYMVSSAKEMGTPDPLWLEDNFDRLAPWEKDLPLLLCGRRAQDTFDKLEYRHRGPLYRIMHPASRIWTRDLLDTTREMLLENR